MRKATDQRDAQIISLLWTSLLPLHGGDVLRFEVKCFDVLVSVAGSRHLMLCNGLCCAMSRDAMRCHGDELYYSSTTLYYKVLLQYYSVLQILLCTTLYYSSTTLYCKVLLKYYPVILQYYLVLQRTTQVLTCTTKYFSSTNLYYKVLLQY